jgi:hypothetical protein
MRMSQPSLHTSHLGQKFFIKMVPTFKYHMTSSIAVLAFGPIVQYRWSGSTLSTILPPRPLGGLHPPRLRPMSRDLPHP